MNRIGQLIGQLKGIVWELDNTQLAKENVQWYDELETVSISLNETTKAFQKRYLSLIMSSKGKGSER